MVGKVVEEVEEAEEVVEDTAEVVEAEVMVGMAAAGASRSARLTYC